MKTHIELLGVIGIVSGVLDILVGAAAVLGLLWFVAIPTGQRYTAIVLIAVFAGLAIALVLGGLSLAAGIGLLKHKAWARILTLALSVLALFNFPIGTAVAVYAFWVLTKEETVALLNA